MARGLLASSAPLHDNRGSRRQRRSGEGSHRGIDCALLNCRDLINIVRLRVRPSAVSRPKSWREQKIDGLFLSVNDAPRLFVRGFEKLLDQRSARQTTTRSGRDSGRSPASAPRGSTLHAMPNPFASSGPLSPAVGANPATQRRNPFASSAPLVGDGGPHGHAAPPPTGPPPTTFSGGFTQPTQQTPPYGQGMYPTPPEMRVRRWAQTQRRSGVTPSRRPRPWLEMGVLMVTPHHPQPARPPPRFLGDSHNQRSKRRRTVKGCTPLRPR